MMMVILFFYQCFLDAWINVHGKTPAWLMSWEHIALNILAKASY